MLRVFFARAWLVAMVVALVPGCGTADSADTARPGETCGRVVLDGGGGIVMPADGSGAAEWQAALCNYPSQQGCGGIVMPADGSEAAECQTALCNYQSQQGCGDEESCVPTVVNDAIEATCAAAGTKRLGAACTSTTPCEAGAVCAGGFCRKLCCAGDWTACDEGESCFTTFSYQLGDTPTPTGAWLCMPVGTCSVLDPHPAACKATEDCKFVDSRGSEACIPKSAGKVGEACSTDAGRLCGAGLTCVGRPDAGTCRRLCRAEECGEPACPAEEGACVHFDRDPPGVGECTPGW